jgi:Tol biopolymer transport system component
MLKRHIKLLILSLTILLASLACGLLDIGVVPPKPTPTLFEPTPLPPVFNPTRTPYMPPEENTILNNTGPWLVFATGEIGKANQDNHLWAANPDGSGLTQLAENFFNKNLVAQEYLGPVVSPYGKQIAYISAGADGLTPELHLVSLPSGQDQLITPLLDPNAVQDYLATLEVILNQAPSLAWSPNGGKLAFIAALEGETADLYLYDVANNTITRLSDGPSQAYLPVWSQDGEWILHSATNVFSQGEGFSPYQFTIDGLWAARSDGTEVREIAVPESDETLFIRYRPWVGSRFLFRGGGSPCEATDNCWLDIVSGENGSFPFIMLESAISPQTNELLTVGLTAPAAAESPSTYYLAPGQSEAVRVTDDLSSLQWLEAAQIFSGKSETEPFLQAVMISNGGILQTIDWPNHPPDYMQLAASPHGQHFAWYRFVNQFETGLWLGNTDGQNLARVFSGEVRHASWAPDSSGVFFTSDSFNDAPTDYTQGVYYAPISGYTADLIKEIAPNEYIQLIGWCGN